MKPLFTEEFLSHHLYNFKLSNVPNIRYVKGILKGLNEELISGKLETLKEEEIKSRFVNEFFGDVLGFNYGNSNFWTLREEVKTSIDGTRPDATLGYFSKVVEDNDVRVVVEIKNASTDLDEKQKRKDTKSPIAQAFEYSSKMGVKCKWVIVSNIKEIRFYSSEFQGKHQGFLLKDLLKEDRLKELLFLFHKDSFIKKDFPSKTKKLYDLSCLNLKENEKPRHIVDEVYTSVKRFKGLSYVDPNYIASIKPFNILDEYVWHYSSNNLLTINNGIHYLFENLDFEGGEIIVSDHLNDECQTLEVIEFKEKIDYFIRFLNHCQITEISCIRDYKKVKLRRLNTIGFSYKHHFSFSEKEGFTKKIDILKYKSCDCISCNYKSLNFKHILNKLKVAVYDEEFKTLEYAYGNYLVSTNNYKESYSIYKKFSEAIKGKEGFEIEYFLAKLNMKYLHNLVWEDENLKDTIDIKKEIRSIDLNRILYDEIEYSIDEDVRNYLLKIKEDQLLTRTQKKVNELHESIINLKKLYDRGGTSFSSNNYHAIANQYFNIQLHFDKNRIVYNVFNDYRLLSAKVFDGLIESSLTQKVGLDSFNSFYLIEFLIHVNIKDFQRILSKVDLVKIDEHSRNKIINSLENLFKSYYEDSRILAHPIKNKVVEEYLLDLHFQDTYVNIVTNAFTLLNKISLSKELFDSLFKTIIKFLNIEDVLSWNNIEEFWKLLLDKGDYFTSDQLKEILIIAIRRDKPNYNKYEGLIENVSKSLNKFYPSEKIEDKRLLKRVIGNLTGTSKRNHISYLLLVTNDECKALLNNEFEEMLDEKFEYNFYDRLIRYKLYDYKKKDYFDKFIKEVNRSKGGGFNGEFVNDIPVIKNFTFYNFAILLNLLEIEKRDEILKKFSDLTEFQKWLIRPKNYNYNLFDVKWVLASDNKHILANLKGISEVENSVSNELRTNFNSKLSKIYYKHLV